MEVLIEAGAGAGAKFSDDAYVGAGATVTTADEVYERADVLACVSPPDDAALHPGQVMLGLLQPLARPDLMRDLARSRITAISLDLLPRTLSRAQSMDALTSQASVAGYKAVLVAVVTGYDVRPETRQEIASLGARFLDLGAAVAAAGTGGYARELTKAERDAQQRALDERIAAFDIVITTAAVPGRQPPVLVTEEALKGMRPGSVVVDLASGPLGGNVALSQPDTELLTDLTIFALAVLVGFEVISKVPATLHTPLMSGANSIHGVVLIGAMVITAAVSAPYAYVLGAVAMAFAAMNVVGGYVVTDRMLHMFRRRPAVLTAPSAPSVPAARAAHHDEGVAAR
jgi:NAD/NADP transhydrogenase alpha subunit